MTFHQRDAAATNEPRMSRDDVERSLSETLIEIRDRVEQRRAIRLATQPQHDTA